MTWTGHYRAMASDDGIGHRGLLLVTVWLHEGRLVGRVRAISSLAGAAYDVATEVGPESLTEAVERWLHAMESTDAARDGAGDPAVPG